MVMIAAPLVSRHDLVLPIVVSTPPYSTLVEVHRAGGSLPVSPEILGIRALDSPVLARIFAGPRPKLPLVVRTCRSARRLVFGRAFSLALVTIAATRPTY